MKTNKIFTGALVLLSLAACNNDLELVNEGRSLNELSTKTINVEPDTITGTLEFLYKGQYYTSLYLSVNDSIIEYENSKVKDVMDYLATQPNATTYMHGDTIEFLDDHEELKKNVTKTNMYRSPAWSARFAIYDDVDYKDRSYESPYLEGEGFLLQIENLKTYIPTFYTKQLNFNDKISSMKLWGKKGIRYLFWEDDTYSGRVLVVDMEGVEQDFPNLKNIPVAGSSKNWNDRISSIEVFTYPLP